MKQFLEIDGSLKEAKKFLADNFDEGANCPCCSQFVKRYSRSLNSGMALGLISLYKIAPNGEFVHVPTEFTKRKINNSNTELSKLVYWGFVEEKPTDDEDEKSSGYWRITANGIKFALKKIRTQKYVQVFNKKVFSFSGELITVVDALGGKFDYKELMKELNKP